LIKEGHNCGNERELIGVYNDSESQSENLEIFAQAIMQAGY
jgi:hypothetical protein